MVGEWHPDPTGRHEFRYWDGSSWTETVSNNGVVSSDPPTLAAPTVPAAATAVAEQTSTTTPAAAPPLEPEPEPNGSRPKWPWIVGAAVLALIVIGAIAGNSDDKDSSDASKTAGAIVTTPTRPSTVATDAPTTVPPTVPPTTVPPTAPPTAPPTSPPSTAPPAPVETPGQANARRSAQQYLSLGNGFSRAGLIEQLSSEFGERFSLEDATYGVDATHTDWNAQACLSAKAYLKLSAFSHEGLVEQLSSEAGEQYTPDEAEYGVACAGL